MNTKPSPEERDWYGVCWECGRMTGTVVQNFGPINENGDRITNDYREVTACCGSEDFLPEEYAIRCFKCNEWVDKRYTHRVGERVICDMCFAESRQE